MPEVCLQPRLFENVLIPVKNVEQIHALRPCNEFGFILEDKHYEDQYLMYTQIEKWTQTKYRVNWTPVPERIINHFSTKLLARRIT